MANKSINNSSCLPKLSGPNVTLLLDDPRNFLPENPYFAPKVAPNPPSLKHPWNLGDITKKPTVQNNLRKMYARQQSKDRKSFNTQTSEFSGVFYDLKAEDLNHINSTLRTS